MASEATVLVVNCGSASVVLSLVDTSEKEQDLLHLEHSLGDDEAKLQDAIEEVADRIDLVAHRLVHGGDRLQPSLVDHDELARLDALAWLAPLHLPPAIEAARQVWRLLPDVPAYACFDTEFHAHLAPQSRELAVPSRWRSDHGIIRYGFHGPGHQWASERTAGLLSLPVSELDVVTVHLGGGASAAAVHGGHSIDTTMGLTRSPAWPCQPGPGRSTPACCCTY